ncbi:unnamed protein product [Parajaminaea phylloscopi]
MSQCSCVSHGHLHLPDFSQADEETGDQFLVKFWPVHTLAPYIAACCLIAVMSLAERWVAYAHTNNNRDTSASQKIGHRRCASMEDGLSHSQGRKRFWSWLFHFLHKGFHHLLHFILMLIAMRMDIVHLTVLIAFLALGDVLFSPPGRQARQYPSKAEDQGPSRGRQTSAVDYEDSSLDLELSPLATDSSSDTNAGVLAQSSGCH